MQENRCVSLQKRLQIKRLISQAGSLHTRQQWGFLPLPFYRRCSVFGDCKHAFLDITMERRMGIYAAGALDCGTEGTELLFCLPAFLQGLGSGGFLLC